ncbi:DNA-directed RNA polymerase I subunit RPA34.5-domain-containing protein [Hypoxylon sp. FL1284]|nr:DNA-directed RNA polymerase I subunit RPA34.5-domain-containing protein [Hypoxylon sp. FL1284]
MAKPRSRAPLGSLDKMASKVRDQKSASQNKSAALKGQDFGKHGKESEASGSDTSSSDSSSSGSSGDDDSDIEAARNKYKAKQATKQKVPEKDKAKSAPTKPTATQPSSKSTTTTTSPDQSESDSDSESSQASGGEEQIPNGIKKKGTKDTASHKPDSGAESSSDEEGSDSNGDESGAENEAGEDASQSDSSDAASEIVSESSEEQGSAMEIDGEETAISRVNGQSASEPSNSQVAHASLPRWLNSSNFTVRKALSDNPAKEVNEFLSKTNLEGKQVWYFTAPASLPITVLRDMEIDLSKAVTGDALLQHEGDEYGMILESEATNTQMQLLIPSPAGDNYAALNRGIDSTVHLRRMAKFGPDSTVSATATTEYTPIPKPVRQQPQNLKPRFMPIGIPAPTPLAQPVRPSAALATQGESESDSDQDMTSMSMSQDTATPTVSKRSKKSNAADGKLKRKHPGDESAKSTPVPASEKSSKRAKTTTDGTQPTGRKETPVRPPNAALASSNGTGKPSKETPTKESTPSKDSKADKAKTKAAKKEKKDAKTKSFVPPTKLTPVPVPKITGMKR